KGSIPSQVQRRRGMRSVVCPRGRSAPRDNGRMSPNVHPVMPIDELLERARVVALPMATRFRGVTVREAMLIEGESRWTEWSPFVEYGEEEAATWLAGALAYGAEPELPGARAVSVAVNATVPAVPPSEVTAVLARYDGCRTV